MFTQEEEREDDVDKVADELEAQTQRCFLIRTHSKAFMRQFYRWTQRYCSGAKIGTRQGVG